MHIVVQTPVVVICVNVIVCTEILLFITLDVYCACR